MMMIIINEKQDNGDNKSTSGHSERNFRNNCLHGCDERIPIIDQGRQDKLPRTCFGSYCLGMHMSSK